MFCPNCGTENSDGSKFCENCGLNFQKLDMSPAMSSKESANYEYEQPIPREEYRTHSPILDGLEDANVADYRDQISSSYYIISFLFFPIGIFLWAFHRDKKPNSAKNVLAASIAGFFMIFLLLVL